MEESFPVKAVQDNFCIVLFSVIINVTALNILVKGSSNTGFRLIVCAAVVMMHVFMYIIYRTRIRDNHCIFDDNGLSMRRTFSTQRIPYLAITNVRDHLDVVGSNDPNSIWISYGKKSTDSRLFRYSLIMSIENKDRVMEILKEKCNSAVFEE